MSWQLFFLGTCSACPTKIRNVSSYGLKFGDGKIVLIDCGEATQHQIARFNDEPKNLGCPLKLNNIDMILITHLHGDHLYGLPGLLATMTMHGRTNPLSIFGPSGLKQYINVTMTLTGLHTSFELVITEIDPENLSQCQGFIIGIPAEKIEIKVFPLKHKLPCIGYLFTEKDLPGRFDVEKAIKLGITNKNDYRLLSQGGSIILPDGRTVTTNDVTGGIRRGRKLLLLGDTYNSDSAIKDAMNADYIVHEATFEACMEEEAIKKGHSTSKMAGKFAHTICAKNLILTHFSARYADEKTDPIKKLVNEAVLECPQTNVFAANDLDIFIVPRNE